MLEKTPESPLYFKEIKPVNPKGNQPWIFIGRIDTEAEAPILWPSDAKSQLIRKDPDAGKDWGHEEKGATEDQMVGGHHWLNEHEFEQTPEDNEEQSILACCSPRGHKEWDMSQQLNNKVPTVSLCMSKDTSCVNVTKLHKVMLISFKRLSFCYKVIVSLYYSQLTIFYINKNNNDFITRTIKFTNVSIQLPLKYIIHISHVL